jgi:3-methyl-2-oxobutanoate hydroxymethyltransferase
MHPLEKKRTIVSLKRKKRAGKKITAVTAYDFPTAKIASEAGIDLILVGDSLGMVLQGHHNTLNVTVDQMIYHTRMVSSAEPLSLVVTDMPFGSYHTGTAQAVENAVRFVKEGGAEAVKLEGGKKRYNVIKAILDAEIPVVGHLGLTPQSVHALGGFRAQGKLKRTADEMVREAEDLEKLGVFAIVLESIPLELGRQITGQLSIPTIGIGAGKYCDGQILVFHDLVGFTDLYLPRFVRKYADTYNILHGALTHYIRDVQEGNFPGEKESFGLNEKEKKDSENGDNRAD